jgi:hypothetical protein
MMRSFPIRSGIRENSGILTTSATYAPLLFLAACLAACGAPQARAQENIDSEKAIETGRRALRESNSYPWYDPQTDELRRVDVRPDRSAENLNRQSQWQTKPWKPAPAPAWSWPVWLSRLFQILAIVLALVIFGLLIWLLVWAFMRREAGVEVASSGSEAADARGDVDRIENLPFQVKRPQSDLRGEAERHYRDGNYREGIIYLYSYLLVQLDRRQVIRLTKGKTNRQYLREVRQRPELVPIFELTMIAFEDVFFGDHPLSRSEFEECWNRLDEFHRLLDQTHQAAA